MSTLSSRAELDGSCCIFGGGYHGILLVRRAYPEPASRVEWALLRMTLVL
jgi:hypothetical protein